jgi:hypothetical protein
MNGKPPSVRRGRPPLGHGAKNRAMHRLAAVLLAGAFSAALAPTPAGAAPKDAYCPEAAAKVEAFSALATANDPAKIAAAAADAAEVYRGCALSATSVGNIEPAVNYDQTRVAQFEFAQARALLLLNKPTEAVRLFRDARMLADRVAAWTPSGMVYINSNRPGVSDSALNRDRKPSSYQKNALAIRDAADAQLAQLGASPEPSAQPAPSPSPGH